MSKIKSPKHPNWTIYKSDTGHWSMQHDQYQGYLMIVWENVHEQWMGEIWTEQVVEDLTDETDWMPAFSNPFEGTVEQVKREIVRRGQYWSGRD